MGRSSPEEAQRAVRAAFSELMKDPEKRKALRDFLQREENKRKQYVV